MRRILLAMTGASGAMLGVRMLRHLASRGDTEVHLILSESCLLTLSDEVRMKASDLAPLAARVYKNADIGAAPASGSFSHDGMLVVPCSIKTLSAVAHCYSSDLISRAADVTLKEGRPLLLGVRETPLHIGHMQIMQQAATMGAVIFPPMPAFYSGYATIEQMVDALVGRMLARIGIENDLYKKWNGLGKQADE